MLFKLSSSLAKEVLYVKCQVRSQHSCDKKKYVSESVSALFSSYSTGSTELIMCFWFWSLSWYILVDIIKSLKILFFPQRFWSSNWESCLSTRWFLCLKYSKFSDFSRLLWFTSNLTEVFQIKMKLPQKILWDWFWQPFGRPLWNFTY